MGEEVAVTEATEVVENGTVPPEKDGEYATEKKEEVQNGVKEMEGDCRDEEKFETTKMDVDKSEAKEINASKTKEETELKGSNEEEKDKGKEEGEHKSEAMDEENVIEEEENVNNESMDKVENAAGLKVAEEKVSKKHGKAKTAGEDVNNKKKAVEEKKEKEKKAPLTPAIERPVRERKSVERLVATIERDAVKEFHIGKGRGTALKDIPNVDWWNAFGGSAIELTKFAKRILGLCCSSSGCERDWSTFEFIHTKKRNRLEHQRLNDLAYVQYNRRIIDRFQKRRELGRNFDPLVLEDFDWGNEWIAPEQDVVHHGDDLTWEDVDRAVGASDATEVHNIRRASNVTNVYSRRGGVSTSREPRIRGVHDSDSDLGEEEEGLPNDDEDVDDDYGRRVTTVSSDDTTVGRENDDLIFDDFA